MRADIWAEVDRLIDRSPSLDDLRSHRLHLLAGRRWRHLGLNIPERLEQDEELAAELVARAPLVLERVRDAYDGELIVLKGPEVAAHYPAACLRPSFDLDILADDARQAQRALLAAGFEPCDSLHLERRHHLHPLRLPGLPYPVVEMHTRPNWPEWIDPAATDELFAVAAPGSLDIRGLLALPPAYHALVVAAHAWVGMPLRRVLDLVDVLAISAESDRQMAEAVAQRWGMSRVWNTTLAAAEAIVLDDASPWSLRIWARNLKDVRDQTVLERHIRPWASPFWALPAHRAVRATATAFLRDVTPARSESWGAKLRRINRAIRNATRPATEYSLKRDDDVPSARRSRSDRGWFRR